MLGDVAGPQLPAILAGLPQRNTSQSTPGSASDLVIISLAVPSASIGANHVTVPCGMTSPAMEERIMELMPDEARAVLALGGDAPAAPAGEAADLNDELAGLGEAARTARA